MRLPWRRSREESEDVDHREAIAAARHEREKSERSLSQAQGTLTVLREMHRRNHIDSLLDAVVASKRQREGET